MAARHDARPAGPRDGPALQFPGVSNAWTMPIKARIDMLATGIRTPVGVKVIGPDLKVIERLAREIEAVLKTVPGTSSAFAERIIGGYYLDIEPDRSALARYGLMVGGRAAGDRDGARRRDGHDDGRGPRALRRQRALSARRALRPAHHVARGAGAAAERGLRAAGPGRQDPAGAGPASIRTENAQLAAYIFVDARDRDLGGYVADAQARGRREV